MKPTVPTHLQHGEYLQLVGEEAAERTKKVRELFQGLFRDLIYTSEHQVVKLGEIDNARLADTLLKYPALLKPLLAICQMGKRAISQDIGLEVDTYDPKLSTEKANAITEYLVPMLPSEIGLDTICELDRHEYIGSAIRKTKGRWEKKVVAALLSVGLSGKKRKFSPTSGSHEEFELDFAMPSEGDIEVGVDIKHIGHQSDKQKRGDEIVNKATKLWQHYPNALFFSIVKYPYPDDYKGLRERLRPSERAFDGLYIAGDDDESLIDMANGIFSVIKKNKPHLLA